MNDEIQHKIHVLACKVLGLDDEDHECDDAAKPLEDAMAVIVQEAVDQATAAR